MPNSVNNLTDVGVSAIINAAASGYQMSLNVNAFKLGSLNTPFSSAATDVPGDIVFTGSSPLLQAVQTPDPNTILYCVNLGPTIGTFDFGSIGLYLSTGELLTYVSLNNIYTKKSDSSLPGAPGNYLKYFIPVQIVRSADLFSITAEPIEPASLPIIQSSASLPAANSAQYNCYLLASDETIGGKPSIAFSDGTTWWHISGLTGNNTSKFTTNIASDGTSTSLVVTHNLGTLDIIGKIYEVADGADASFGSKLSTFGGVYAGYTNNYDIVPLTTNTAVVNFQYPPAAGTSLRVIIIG